MLKLVEVGTFLLNFVKWVEIDKLINLPTKRTGPKWQNIHQLNIPTIREQCVRQLQLKYNLIKSRRGLSNIDFFFFFGGTF